MNLNDIPQTLKEMVGENVYNAILVGGKAIGVILLSIIIARTGKFIIKKLFEKQKDFRYGIESKKLNTMSTLLVSIFRYAVYLFAGIIILSDVLDLKSVLAAAGIGGIAVGFGAQSLIKDIISGFFIVMEDHYSVGDMITIDTMTGTVEKLELRVTRFRNFNGDLYIIPNGEIRKVTNHTRGNKAAIIDIPIAYGSDINKAFDAANRVCELVNGEFRTITEESKVLGITDMDKYGMILRIMAKTLPNEQWEVERKIRKLIREEFEKEKLEFFDKNRMVLDEEG